MRPVYHHVLLRCFFILLFSNVRGMGRVKSISIHIIKRMDIECHSTHSTKYVVCRACTQHDDDDDERIVSNAFNQKSFCIGFHQRPRLADRMFLLSFARGNPLMYRQTSELCRSQTHIFRCHLFRCMHRPNQRGSSRPFAFVRQVCTWL